MIVFIAIACHAATITIANHADFVLASILLLKNPIPSLSPIVGRIYVKIKLKI